jgi:hypothetical protein
MTGKMGSRQGDRSGLRIQSLGMSETTSCIEDETCGTFEPRRPSRPGKGELHEVVVACRKSAAEWDCKFQPTSGTRSIS